MMCLQAMTIMAHFHALSSFTLGCGLIDDVDFIVDEQTPSPQDESPIDGGPIDAQTREAAEIEEVSSVIARLRQATEAEDVEDPKEINESNFVNADTEGPRTVLEQNALASGASFPPFMCSPEAQVDGDNPKSHITGHVDFDIRTKEYSVLRTHEFSWADQCFSTLNRYVHNCVS